MPKEIVVSPHALAQLRERGLSLEQIIQVIREPEQVIGSGARPIAQRRMSEGWRTYLLRVAYTDAADTITVVTAYRTSKVAKYWRNE